MDEAAWIVATTYIKDPTLIAKRVEELREAHKITDDATHVVSALEAVKRKFVDLYKLAEESTDDDTLLSLTIRLKDLEKQKRELERMLGDIVEEDEIKQLIQEEITRFEDWANTVRPLLDDPAYQATYDDKVLAIRVLGIQVKVYPASYPERYEVDVAPPRILRVVNVGVQTRCNRQLAR